MAVLVAIPVIYFLSVVTSLFGNDEPGIWDWNIFHHSPIKHGHRDDSLIRVIDLTGSWRFALGDDLTRAQPDFDDDDWKKIHVPNYWEHEGLENYDGFGWYRRHFSLDADRLNSMLYAELGMIDDTDEVFVNGQRIGGSGQFPPSYIGAWNQHRQYAIPQGLIREGDNVIAVRVYDAQMGGGIYKGEVGIYATRHPAPLVNLEGEWQFWREGEQEQARSIRVPGLWEHQGVQGYDGIAWYRKEFGQVDINKDETLVLLLGRIDDTDEVTLNGEFIGRTGNLNDQDRKIDRDYFRIERRYEFSASLLKANNVLEVRVHDNGGDGGIYQGPVAILTKSAYEKYSHEKTKG